MPDDGSTLANVKSKGNWDKNKKLYVGLAVAGIVVTYYLYSKGKSSSGSAVTSASPATGTSASSAYAAGAQAQAAQDQQFVASLQSMGGASGGGVSWSPNGQLAQIYPGATAPGSTGTPGSPSTGTPGNPSTGTPSTSNATQYTGIQDPFWGQQGVAVPQSLTPGTAIYMNNPTTGAYQFGGTYQPTAGNEYNIQGLPSAQARQAAGFSTGLYTAG